MRYHWKRVKISEKTLLTWLEDMANQHSNCLRRKVAAIVRSKDGKMHPSGMNGYNSCAVRGCLREKVVSGTSLERCRGVHAEIRALLNALPYTKEGTLYVTHFPCSHCAPMIAEFGIKEVVYRYDYGDEQVSAEILVERGITIRREQSEPSEENQSTL